MLRHTYVTTMLDASVDLRDVRIAARHADPEPPCATTAPAPTSTATPNVRDRIVSMDRRGQPVNEEVVPAHDAFADPSRDVAGLQVYVDHVIGDDDPAGHPGGSHDSRPH